jgi:hypothetical protein
MQQLENAKTCYSKAIELGENQWAPKLLKELVNSME